MITLSTLLLTTGIVTAAAVDKPAPGVIGRFSPLRWIGKHDTVTIGNAGYTVDIQRVFKVNALVPQVQSGTYGQVAFAGALNMRTPDGHWLTDLPASEYSITSKQSGPWLADVTQSVDHDGWKGALTAHFAAGYPSLWFHYARTAGTGPIAGAVMGYDWAGRFAPLAWTVGDTSTTQPLTRTNGHTLDVPLGDSRTIYATYHDDRGITGCLRFSPAPSSLKITDSGVFWEYAGDVDNADVEYLTATSGTSDDAIAVAAKFPQAPTSLTETFAQSTDGRSSVTLDSGGSGLMIPAALTSEDDTHVSTVEGNLGVDATSTRTFALPSPPNINNLTPSFRALPVKDQARVNAWVRGIVKTQLPSGSFGFSQQRGFYDSMTCCSLAEVYPELPANLKPAVRKALVKGLDHLWRDQKDCKIWPGVSVAPEQDFFIQTGVDYAEIMGFTLQATALYGANVDARYVDKHWPSIDRQFAQLRIYDDWSGLSYANPGPDFYQIIPEGSIGGYLAWHALYHLAKAHGHAQLAAEARARAAMSYQGILSLYRWKPEFGEAVVNGINQGHLEVIGESPWTYFQYAWFTFLPGFALPHEDTFHIWHMLAKMPWWNWTDTLHSRQRANDGANVSALWRGGYMADVQAHPAVIPGRPVWWDAFDFTPVLLIPAEYWIHSDTSTAASTGTRHNRTSSNH